MCAFTNLYTNFVLVTKQRFYIHISSRYVVRRMYVMLHVFYSSNLGVILFTLPARSGCVITSRIVAFDPCINSSEVAKEIF